MTHQPTPEQSRIISAATSTPDNLLISALAGAAKTSTLVMVAEALPDTRMLCLSFNKKIATEMQERLPSNCIAMTLNGLGHRVWGEVLGRRLIIDAGKVGDILKAKIDVLEPELKKLAYAEFADLIKAVGFGKACGYIPDGYGRGARPLMCDEEFQAHSEERWEDWEWELIESTSRESLDMAWKGVCDFDDQILMPTIFPAVFPRYPLVLVDEAQDLSALNHATLKKLVVKRLIAVGDPCQAIYGFRGAHEESMELLEETFKMTKLLLSISFRCPISIVEHARWRAPHMEYPSWAVPGLVSHPPHWDIPSLAEHAAVICRNNAPLFSLAVKMLQQGRYAQLVGNDIGKGLVKILTKFGPGNLPKKEVLEAIDKWEKLKIQKNRSPAAIRDRAACMRIFAEQGRTLSDAIAYAEHLFSSQGPVKLMTGHKSKGLEFDDVYFLESALVGDEGQERNLRYVIITRAKRSLTYINFEDLVSPEPAA